MQIKVLYNKQILPLYYKLGIQWTPLPAIQAGQFAMLRINDRLDPLLRRPFGVYNVLKNGIEIVYKVVGKGTRLMTVLKEGDTVDVLGPLGNGFPAAEERHQIIMVAGGIGIAPFYMIAKSYQRSAGRLKLLFGGRAADDLPALEDFQKMKMDMKISTDDGSIGKKGFVTELLKKELKTQGSKLKTVIYACGPKGMLKAVAKIAQDADTPCYVSLDNAMACGIGACLGCAVKIQEFLPLSPSRGGQRGRLGHKGEIYKMVCKDGPVFDAKEIAWENI